MKSVSITFLVSVFLVYPSLIRAAQVLCKMPGQFCIDDYQECCRNFACYDNKCVSMVFPARK